MLIFGSRLIYLLAHHFINTYEFFFFFSFSSLIKVATEKLSVLKSKMIEFGKSHDKDVGEGLEVLLGVECLLEALSSRFGVFIGLVSLHVDIFFAFYPTQIG